MFDSLLLRADGGAGAVGHEADAGLSRLRQPGTDDQVLADDGREEREALPEHVGPQSQLDHRRPVAQLFRGQRLRHHPARLDAID